MPFNNIKLNVLRSYIASASIEVFEPYKTYRKGSIVTKTGSDLYKCLAPVPEPSISNSHNWIRLK